MNGIYLDNNATTKVDEKVFLAMRPYLTANFAHPYNTEEDVDYTVGGLARIVGHTQIGAASAETVAVH